MDSHIADPDQLYAYAVHDSSDHKVGGKVEIVWVDEATKQPEFVGVNTNWLLKGKVHAVPLVDAEFGDKVIRVPYSQDQIKGSPQIGTDVELIPAVEEQVYAYYGLQRPAGVGPTARPVGSGLDDGSIVIPGTQSPFTGDAETLEEAREKGEVFDGSSAATGDTGSLPTAEVVEENGAIRLRGEQE